MLIRPLRLLGEYNRVTAIYDEVERLLNADTVNQNYLEILRGRAEILTAQGRHAEARRYWRRQAALNELLTERLMQGRPICMPPAFMHRSSNARLIGNASPPAASVCRARSSDSSDC